VRELFNDVESAIEDVILDKMDLVWRELSHGQQVVLDIEAVLLRNGWTEIEGEEPNQSFPLAVNLSRPEVTSSWSALKALPCSLSPSCSLPSPLTSLCSSLSKEQSLESERTLLLL
jgi:hypothetical protein